MELQLRCLGLLISESPHNLVSSRDRKRMTSVHLPECVAAIDALPAGDGQHWLDLGTGGGLPGLVGAIRRPRIGWTLVDARQKKVDAVAGFIDRLELENARVVAGRAEVLAWQEVHRGRYDGVVSRALARLDVVAELARGFLVPGGRLAAVKGPALEAERGYFQRVSGRLRMREIEEERIGSEGRSTTLVTIAAVGRPPRGIPRANGIPQSSPIGGTAS